jgi:hypothetical protein
MAHLIKVVCGDARRELCSGDVEDLPSQSTDLTHRILRLGVQKLDLGPVETILARRYSRLSPVRTLYRPGKSASGGKGIDGSDRAGKWKCREWVV